MIDDYLKTSLIFYDSADKQDWRKKVLENIRIPKAQMVERYRLPPFSIKSTVLIGVPTVFGLYNKYTHIETANLLGGTYDGANLISLEWDGIYYWLVYDGETNLGEPMPLGEQYVRISDGFRTWESEIIKIANCPNNVMDWHGKHIIEMIYNTFKRGNESNIIAADGTMSPNLYYYNNKTYGSWQQKGGIGYSCESMVYAIYHKKCFISENYGIGPGTLNGCDPHAIPTVLVADDGHIVIAHERLTGVACPPVFNHNGFMQIKRSDNPEDETSWINAIAHNVNYFDEKGNEAANRLSYPSLDKLSNGKLFLFCRHSSIADLNRVSLHRSADHGISWNDLGGNIDGGCDVVDLRPIVTGSDLIYKGLCKHPDDDILHLFVYWKDAPTNNYPDLYYLKSLDNGVHWTDVSNSYVPDGPLGRNITTAGNNPIPKVDLDNVAFDFLVKNIGSPDNVLARSGVITDTGIPYIAGCEKIGADYHVYIFYWNGAAWIETDTGFDENIASHILQRGDVMELILPIINNGTLTWSSYRSRTLTAMNDWTLIKEIKEDVNDTTIEKSLSYTFNYTEALDESLMTMFDRRPGAYSDLYIFAESEDCNCCSGLSRAITIEYENIHDFAGILSEYKGRVHLCADVRKPDHKIIKSGKERDGENWIQKIITQKIYRFNILCTESLIDTLTMIPSYETITVYFDNESAEVKEFNVAPPEWKYEGLGQLEISFIVESIIKTNCDEDYVLQEELILNGDFSAWTGVAPNRDPDDWTIVEVPNAEITEVAPNEGWGGVGTGACNIYSPAAEDTYLFPTVPILIIGKSYLIKIKITKIINNRIKVRTDLAGDAVVLSTEGIHKFIIVADTVNLYIQRSAICDVTIDNVSVKLYS